MLAFGMRDYNTDKFKEDPKRIKWEVHIYEGDGKTDTLAQVALAHKCTELEWKKFYTPARKSKSRMEILKSRDVMFCMNTNDQKGKPVNINLFEPSDTAPHRHIEFMVKPCIPG